MKRDGGERSSIRLRDYDYSQAGAYFLTICTVNRVCLFGEIIENKMRLNGLGRIVEDEWKRSALTRSEIELDSWVIMPNHLHGIVVIKASDEQGAGVGQGLSIQVGNPSVAPTGTRPPAGKGDPPVAPTGPRRKSIGAMVAGFKSAATTRINGVRGRYGVRVWQRNDYEHVIRDEDSLNIIRQYIMDNPAKWDEDPENPHLR